MTMTPTAAKSDRVFQRYRHDVYAWAYRLLGRHHDALDVAQDVFLRWTKRSAAADAPTNPRAWLRTVTINRSVDVIRSRTAAAAGEMAATIGEARPSEADREELRAAIARAMAPLSDMQRAVLTARVFEDLTFAQIAAEHELALPTVKTHYLRALRAVRDRLGERWRDEGVPS
jgi:RNA polymerase sigma-70 factor (ECF subfamily)